MVATFSINILILIGAVLFAVIVATALSRRNARSLPPHSQMVGQAWDQPPELVEVTIVKGDAGSWKDVMPLSATSAAPPPASKLSVPLEPSPSVSESPYFTPIFAHHLPSWPFRVRKSRVNRAKHDAEEDEEEDLLPDDGKLDVAVIVVMPSRRRKLGDEDSDEAVEYALGMSRMECHKRAR
ncbi:hypothetical protein BXZ70DRAFT_544282 [Cristinia sonorae]|uniref:Uncharacterized protein n=1 Tax=Cristinia sonorae TaxID=1940300 RepID=A0A8K0XL64_9AGAR|nr:hypothetical protein BXZ70DRAFT_544282 [Cristinia sonorae]